MNGEYPKGTFAYFICDDGYMRNGPTFSRCQDTGIWDPQIATCNEGIAKNILF